MDVTMVSTSQSMVEGNEEVEGSMIFKASEVEVATWDSSKILVKKRGSGRPKGKGKKKRRNSSSINISRAQLGLGHNDQEEYPIPNPIPSNSSKIETQTPVEVRKRQIPQILPILPLKRSSLELQCKLTIIEELTAGVKQATLCRRLRIPSSTVQSIWKNRDKITSQVVKHGSERKRCRGAQYENVETNLMKWVAHLKAANMPISGPQLRSKAQTLAKQFGLVGFRASTGWLDKFKARNKIILKKGGKPRDISGRKLATEFCSKVWPMLCEDFLPTNIFSLTVTGLFFSSLPTKNNNNWTCSNGELSESRFSILLTANSNGSEKRRVCVIGNLNEPKSMERIQNKSNLPVSWSSDSKSWVSQIIFEDWIQNWNEELKIINRKVLLLIDPSSCPPVKGQLSNINLVRLPVSKTIDPLNHGVVHEFKKNYRRLLLNKLIHRKSDIGNGNIQISPKISILESLLLIFTAWEGIQPNLIRNSFEKANLLPIGHLITNEQFKIYDGDIITELEEDQLTFLDSNLINRARTIGIQIPENITINDYAKMDDNLETTRGLVTSYNSSKTLSSSNIGLDKLTPLHEEDIPQIPDKEEIHRSIDTLRYFLLLSPEKCNEVIHTVLSQLENRILLQLQPQFQELFETSSSSNSNSNSAVSLSTSIGPTTAIENEFYDFTPAEISDSAEGINSNDEVRNFFHLPIVDSETMITVMMTPEEGGEISSDQWSSVDQTQGHDHEFQLLRSLDLPEIPQIIDSVNPILVRSIEGQILLDRTLDAAFPREIL